MSEQVVLKQSSYIYSKESSQTSKELKASTMDYLPILLLISFVWATIYVLIGMIKTSKSSKYPPGPRPFPIIGNILELGKLPHLSLAKLSHSYGPIMSLKLGSMTAIVISSPEATKEAMQKNDQIFSYRPTPDTLRALDHHIYSLAWMQPSAQWRNLRKLCATKVFAPRMLDSTQFLRQKKVQELMDYVKERSKKGEALDIGKATFNTVLNSISNTLFSKDLVHYTSDKYQEFKEIISGITEEAGKPNFVDFFPILSVLDPQGARARMKSYFAKLIAFFDGLIEERLSLRGKEMESKKCKDVLDSMLELMMEDNSELSRDLVLHLFVVSILATKFSRHSCIDI